MDDSNEFQRMVCVNSGGHQLAEAVNYTGWHCRRCHATPTTILKDVCDELPSKLREDMDELRKEGWARKQWKG